MPFRRHPRHLLGFTVVEVLVIVVVISILASITVVSYGAWRHRTADSVVRSDLTQATNTLKSYKNFKNSYPPNLADTGFAASDEVALKLSTNAAQVPQYENLTPDQNAQLFLNSCNAAIVPPNTSCTFAGNNVHVGGTGSSNVVWQGPTLTADQVVLTCGSACTAAAAAMKQTFLDQGGTFPIAVPKQQVELPAPTLVSSGPASKFCLQAASGRFTDIFYHTTSQDEAVKAGVCPNDPELHYP